MSEIPSSFYFIVGSLVVANLGSLLGILVFIFKAGMFVKATEKDLEALAAKVEDAKSYGVRAHKRIDKISEKD